jgi:hypothetical protein
MLSEQVVLFQFTLCTRAAWYLSTACVVDEPCVTEPLGDATAVGGLESTEPLDDL